MEPSLLACAAATSPTMETQSPAPDPELRVNTIPLLRNWMLHIHLLLAFCYSKLLASLNRWEKEKDTLLMPKNFTHAVKAHTKKQQAAPF